MEDVEIQGHIIDSLILPKVLDEILTHGGSYVLKEIRVGQRQTDLSYARIEVRAPTPAALREILDVIHDHGAMPTASQAWPSMLLPGAVALPRLWKPASTENMRLILKPANTRSAVLVSSHVTAVLRHPERQCA